MKILTMIMLIKFYIINYNVNLDKKCFDGGDYNFADAQIGCIRKLKHLHFRQNIKSSNRKVSPFSLTPS